MVKGSFQAVPVKSHAGGMFARCRFPLMRRPCCPCRGLGCPQPAFQNIRKGYSETLLAKTVLAGVDEIQ